MSNIPNDRGTAQPFNSNSHQLDNDHDGLQILGPSTGSGSHLEDSYEELPDDEHQDLLLPQGNLGGIQMLPPMQQQQKKEGLRKGKWTVSFELIVWLIVI